MSSISDGEASSSVRTKLNAALAGDFSASGTNTGLPKPGPIGSGTPGSATFTSVAADSLTLTTPLAAAQGGTGGTTETGTGANVKAVSPSLTTPNIGAATGTSLAVSGQLTSTVATGTAPLAVSSTTAVANFNASLLLGGTWAAPGSIGSGTPAAGAFTTLSATGKVSTAASATGGAGLSLPHGAAPTSPVNGDIWTTTNGLFCRINGATLGPVSYAVGLLTDLGSTYVPSNVDTIQTTGYSIKGQGAARYVTTATTGATAYRKQSADGRWWTLSEDDPYVDQYGALGDGTTDDLAAFVAMLTHIGRFRYVRRAYTITDTIDATGSYGGVCRGPSPASGPSNRNGYFAGAAGSIRMTGNNKPILKIYGPEQVSDISLHYATQQTVASHPNSIALSVNGVSPQCVFNNITIDQCTVGIGIPQSAFLPVGAATYNNSFGMTFNNVYIDNWTESAIDLRNYNSGGTNVTFSNVYLNGGAGYQWANGAGTTFKYAIRAKNINGLRFDNISIDAGTCSEYLVELENCLAVFGHFRTENIAFTKATPRVFSFVGTGGSCIIHSFEMSDSRIRTADGVSGAANIFYNEAGEHTLRVGQLKFDALNAFTATSTNLKLLYVGDSDQFVDIGPVINYTAATSGNGIVLDTWNSANFDRDQVRTWCGSTVVEMRKCPIVTNAAFPVHYLTESWGAPGGGGYSTTKSWAANAEIVVVDPGANKPSRYKKASAGTSAASGWETQAIRQVVTTVASLPAASAVNKGFSTMVTDANSTTFNATAAGGGGNTMKVTSNGTVWTLG